MEKGNKKIIRGWVMYDWANSVYNLVISSAIFPIFYDNVTRKKYIVDKVNISLGPISRLDFGLLYGNSKFKNSQHSEGHPIAAAGENDGWSINSLDAVYVML